MNEEQVRDALVRLNHRHQLLMEDHIDWMLPYIIEGDQTGIGTTAIARQLKNHDEDIGIETKKRLGLRGNVKLSTSLYLTLTPKAYADLETSLAAIINCASFFRNRERDRVTALKLNRPQRMSAVLDSRTCAAAKAMHSTIFEPGDEPHLPLPECDVLACRCTFIGHYPKAGAPAP
jgi:hypothetical protein